MKTGLEKGLAQKTIVRLAKITIVYSLLAKFNLKIATLSISYASFSRGFHISLELKYIKLLKASVCYPTFMNKKFKRYFSSKDVQNPLLN